MVKRRVSLNMKNALILLVLLAVSVDSNWYNTTSRQITTTDRYDTTLTPGITTDWYFKTPRPIVTTEEPCGGDFGPYTKNGIIKSPNYPNDYPDNAFCRWNITADVNSVIVLKNITEIHLEGCCGCDYIKVFDVQSNGRKILQETVCAWDDYLSFRSSGSQMVVEFSSDGSQRFEGFKAQWWTVDRYNTTANTTDWYTTTSRPITTTEEPCGGDFGPDTKNGTIQSPNYPNNYPNNAFCRWNITADENSVIVLNIAYMDLEHPGHCHDTLDVFDVLSNGTWILQRTLCGDRANLSFRSSGSKMIVEFSSDGSGRNRGFDAQWWTVEEPCGGDFGPDTKNGTIQSPNYPYNYPNNAFCRWNLTANNNSVIVLNIAYMDLEHPGHCHDTLKVFDVLSNETWILQRTLCGDRANLSFRSSGSKMIVEFASDSSGRNRGFDAQWWTVAYDFCYSNPCGNRGRCDSWRKRCYCYSPWTGRFCENWYTTTSTPFTTTDEPCGGDFGPDTKNGTIKSPNYPNNYPDNAFCRWNITVNNNSVIVLKNVTDIHLEGCCVCDSIKVYDVISNGTWILQETLCGRDGDLSFRSSGSQMVVEFSSDGSVTSPGFKAQWWTVDWYTTTSTPITTTAHDFCYPNPCANGARCDRWRQMCYCYNGWTGRFCDEDINECLINNGGCDHVCSNTYGSSSCACFAGFIQYGRKCFAVTTPPTTTTTTPKTTASPIHHDFFCDVTSMTIHIPISLLPNSKLTLRDPVCQLKPVGNEYVRTFHFDECGTSVSYYTDVIYVYNEVKVHKDFSSVGFPIVVDDDFVIPIKCSLNRTALVEGVFQTVTREPIVEIEDKSTSNKYLLYVLREYKTEAYKEEITAYPVQIPINREIFLELSVNESKPGLGIEIERCYATPTPDPKDSTSFTLMQKGCPAHSFVHLIASSTHTKRRFKVQAFHFSGPKNDHDKVYIHCQVKYCLSYQCDDKDCSKRRRRRNAQGVAPRYTSRARGDERKIAVSVGPLQIH